MKEQIKIYIYNYSENRIIIVYVQLTIVKYACLMLKK